MMDEREELARLIDPDFGRDMDYPDRLILAAADRILANIAGLRAQAWVQGRDAAAQSAWGLAEEYKKLGESEMALAARTAYHHARALTPPDQMQRDPADTFQVRVGPWMQACFGPEISSDRVERNHRFLEEALELVQSNGCTEDEASQLVTYVYGRDPGEINQEVGGVMVTLAALCLASGLDMHAAGETELARIWTKVEQIRAKQAAKPRNSPLPGPRHRPVGRPEPPAALGGRDNG